MENVKFSVWISFLGLILNILFNVICIFVLFLFRFEVVIFVVVFVMVLFRVVELICCIFYFIIKGFICF